MSCEKRTRAKHGGELDRLPMETPHLNAGRRTYLGQLRLKFTETVRIRGVNRLGIVLGRELWQRRAKEGVRSALSKLGSSGGVTRSADSPCAANQPGKQKAYA